VPLGESHAVLPVDRDHSAGFGLRCRTTSTEQANNGVCNASEQNMNSIPEPPEPLPEPGPPPSPKPHPRPEPGPFPDPPPTNPIPPAPPGARPISPGSRIGGQRLARLNTPCSDRLNHVLETDSRAGLENERIGGYT
jgi:hypothetical protein